MGLWRCFPELFPSDPVFLRIWLQGLDIVTILGKVWTIQRALVPRKSTPEFSSGYELPSMKVDPSWRGTIEALQGNLLLREVLRGLCGSFFEGPAGLCGVPWTVNRILRGLYRWVLTLCL